MDVTFNPNALKLTLKQIYIQLVPLATFYPACYDMALGGLSWGPKLGKGGKLPNKNIFIYLAPFLWNLLKMKGNNKYNHM